MQLPISDEVKLLLNPYMFILKEDKDTQENVHSLQMLQVGHLETLSSPNPDQIHLYPLLYRDSLANNSSVC